jgi:hypothetical protein
VLKWGLINRIGLGDINIWQDNWIPGLRSLKPLVRMPKATAERVCDLFIPGTRVWDDMAVHKSFMAIEAAEVLKIKPSAHLEGDGLAWAFEKNGTYSVRSAYRLLKEDQAAEAMAVVSETGASDDDCSWNAVWKLSVPPKVCLLVAGSS